MISMKCPTCGHQLDIPEEFAGKTGRCARCETAVDVPENRKPSPKLEKAYKAIALIFVAGFCLAAVAVHLQARRVEQSGEWDYSSAKELVQGYEANLNAQAVEPIPAPKPLLEHHEQTLKNLLNEPRFTVQLAYMDYEQNCVVIEVQARQSPDSAIGEVGERLVLKARNALYRVQDSDPNWNYEVQIRGGRPGPNLEYIYGYAFFFAKTGEVRWYPAFKIQNDTSWAYQ